MSDFKKTYSSPPPSSSGVVLKTNVGSLSLDRGFPCIVWVLVGRQFGPIAPVGSLVVNVIGVGVAFLMR
ncbi:hypothetical protein Taro_039531 [Colocasia esculenta]|uniref:Uncharacterized protein n=1 Tax=Colocasia esculenta TaxID=4460 RepID=A0A843WW06_COLES|nr:hypothetical protein [Colocasia esculenta]